MQRGTGVTMLESNSAIVAAIAVREGRRCKLVGATLGLPDGTTSEIMIRNISTEGLGAFTRGNVPEVGSGVSVTIAAIGTFSGTIRWRDGQAFGIELDASLAADEIAAAAGKKVVQESSPVWDTSRLHRVDQPRPRGILRPV